MLLHSSKSASFSSGIVVGGDVRLRMRLFKLSHMCSVGLRSGLRTGHGNLLMLTVSRYSATILASCGAGVILNKKIFSNKWCKRDNMWLQDSFQVP